MTSQREGQANFRRGDKKTGTVVGFKQAGIAGTITGQRRLRGGWN